MKEFLTRNIVFISLSLMLIIALGLALIIVPKGDLHLFLCHSHTPARDIFYRYYTHVAEWFPYVLCVMLLLFGRLGDGCFASACQALSALTTQALKHIIVAPRPITWFESHYPDIQLPVVDGVQMNYWLSFPSGHTTSFFALAFALCIIATSRLGHIDRTSRMSWVNAAIQFLLFFAATLGGYSRIYLSQHFAADVLGGIIVGIGITIVCFAVFSHFEDKKWYNFRVFAKK